MNERFHDNGNNYCPKCGRKWPVGDYRPWWPVKIVTKHLFTRKRPTGWGKGFFSIHYWQTGWKDVDVRAFRRVIRIGRLIILTGPDKVDTGLTYISKWNAWLHPEHAEKALQYIREEDTVEAAERFVGGLWTSEE